MKLIITFCLTVSYVFFGFSQITLTDADFPGSGELYTVSTPDSILIDYSSTGANFNWDFSSLTYITQNQRECISLSGAPIFINFVYGPLASSAYRATYYTPFSDLPLDQFGGMLPLQIEEVNQFVKKTTSKVNLLGYSAKINGQSLPIKSDTIETKYNLPLQYGDDYSSSGYTYLDMSMFMDADWKQFRHRHTIVDGWGTIATPYGTFDVLRLKHHVQEIDSVTYQGIPFGMTLPDVYEYEWIAQGEKVPVFKVTTAETNGNEVITSIEYKDNNYSGIASAKVEGLSIFPNPVNDELNIKCNESIKLIEIFDVNGTIVKRIHPKNFTNNINVRELNRGLYIVTLTTDSHVVNTNFIKE